MNPPRGKGAIRTRPFSDHEVRYTSPGCLRLEGDVAPAFTANVVAHR